MTDDAEPTPPTRLIRASDHDREAAAEKLRAAVADGRLELAELDERMTAVYQSKTRAELVATTSDLEVPAEQSKPLTLRTKSGVLRRTGSWPVPAEIIAESTSGLVTIDFTEAKVPYRDLTVRATTKSGRIVMIVPRGWAVVMDDISSSSGMIVNKVGGDLGPAGHTVRVTGTVSSGTIKARHPRRSFLDWLFRRHRS